MDKMSKRDKSVIGWREKWIKKESPAYLIVKRTRI